MCITKIANELIPKVTKKIPSRKLMKTAVHVKSYRYTLELSNTPMMCITHHR